MPTTNLNKPASEMTMLDHFAAYAMVGLLYQEVKMQPKEIASVAYKQAEAMILERHGLDESALSK